MTLQIRSKKISGNKQSDKQTDRQINRQTDNDVYVERL